MKILAVDLGLRTCGYVICEINGLKIELLKEGQIEPNSKNKLPEKLHDIFDKLEKEILNYRPQAIVTEKLYSHYRHPTTLGILAQVKGVISLLSCRCNINYFEFSPTRARKAMIGKGNVNSAQIKKMAENILGRSLKSVHTADAFSLLFAFSHNQKFSRITKAGSL